MIDASIIDKAAAAIYQSTVFGDEFATDAWNDMPDTSPVKITTRQYARAALRTAAPAIASAAWEQGAQSAWVQTYEGWNGEYAGSHGTHSGRVTFREANPDAQNPYSQDTE